MRPAPNHKGRIPEEQTAVGRRLAVVVQHGGKCGREKGGINCNFLLMILTGAL